MDYEIKGPIIVRSPILSLNDLITFIDDKNEITLQKIKNELKNPAVAISLLLASPSLYSSITSEIGNQSKEIYSFIKYYNRMSVRSTPYGMCAYVSLDGIKSQDQLVVKLRPDDVWIDNVIKKLLAQEDIFIQTSVKLNGSVADCGLYYRNYISSPYEKSTNSRLLKKSNIIQMIFNLCRDKFVSVKEIYRKTISINDGSVEPRDILIFLYSLVMKGYLVSNLDISFDVISRLEKILDVIDTKQYSSVYSSKLQMINSLFEKLNSNPLFINENNLLLLQKKMIDCAEATQYFDCVTTSNLINDNFNDEIVMKYNQKKDIFDFINLMTSITRQLPMPLEYQKFIAKFLERYGENMFVPLLEVINPKNVGIPNVLDELDFQNEISRKLRNSIRIRIDNSYIDNSYQIDLDDDQIYDLLNENNNKAIRLSKSFELMFSEGYIDNKRVEHDKTYLATSIGSNMIGNTVGRFYDGFPENGQQYLKAAYKELEELYEKDGIDLVKCNYRTVNAGLLNLVPQVSLTKTSLDLGIQTNSQNVIDINDILVGIQSGNVYFKNKRTNHYIQIVSLSNLNAKVVSPLYYFLIMYSQNVNPLSSMSIINSEIKKHQIQPRVVYKSLVISPLTICLKKDIFKNEISIKSIANYIKQYINNSYIYLKMNDNKLLIDINNSKSMEILETELKKEKVLLITEAEDFIPNSSILQTHKFNFSEEVIPFWNEKSNPINAKTSILYDNKIEDIRNVKIGDDWVSLYMYIDSKVQRYFLIKFIYPFLKRMMNEKIVINYFFIRYSDLRNHIRLRLKIEKGKERIFFELFNVSIYSSNIIEKCTINEYIREIERYGGIDKISLFENYFCANSKLALRILKENKKESDIDATMVLLISNIIDSSPISNKKIQKSLNKYTLYSKEYRELRPKLIQLSREKDLIRDYILVDDDEAKQYFNSLKEYSEDYIERIIYSCIHMFCNRVYGTDREKENQIYSFVKRWLSSRKYYEN